MEKIEQFEKVCSFFVNDWHLTTMILPYIKQKLEENTKIISLLENGIQDHIREILSKMNLNNKLAEKILEINWTSSKLIKYSKIKEILENISKEEKDVEIFISGNKEYIELMNQNIEKARKNIKIRNKIQVINCYDMTKFNNVSDITKNHQYILNTSGMKKVEKVFETNDKKEA